MNSAYIIVCILGLAAAETYTNNENVISWTVQM